MNVMGDRNKAAILETHQLSSTIYGSTGGLLNVIHILYSMDLHTWTYHHDDNAEDASDCELDPYNAAAACTRSLIHEVGLL